VSDLDLSGARLPPYAHQVDGVRLLVENAYAGLFDEMGAGKTKQTIDAAHVLFERGVIDRVLVLAPATVRPVWFDSEFGELAKHLWGGVPSKVTEYHARCRTWHWFIDDPLDRLTKKVRHLEWMVTNYEFLRQTSRLTALLPFVNERTLLVIDEGSAVSNARAKQTLAVARLRARCGRVVILNGTPISNSPGDMFSQGNLMHPSILETKYLTQFRARYALMGGFKNKQVVRWVNLEDLQRRFTPFVVRRLKKDCLDLPERLPPVTMSVALTPESWERYKEMRDELIVWLDEQTVATAPQAVVKVLRLSQLTSGFLGGLSHEVNEEEEHAQQTLLDAVDRYGFTADEVGRELTHAPVREVSREKLDFLLAWLDERLEADPTFKLIVWSRFRPEQERLVRALAEDGRLTLGEVRGGQSREERAHALRLGDPRTTVPGAAVLAGITSAGAMGLNLTAFSAMMYTSNSYSLFHRLQSTERIDRPGQTRSTSYFDLVATGPKGQKTIDHAILRAIYHKHDVATWTTKDWVRAITEE
jgi:hypothetical protein